MTTDEELHGGHNGLLIKHLLGGWARREEAGDPGSATACSRTNESMDGWIGWRFRRPESSVGRACRWRWISTEDHAFVTLLAKRMRHKIGSSPRLRGLSPFD